VPPPMTRRPVWIDGTLVPGDEARVSVLSHAMQRGSLVFDVGALRETAGGGVACFRPREHIERFLASARLVGLDVIWDGDALLHAMVETARASKLSSALVRWSAFVPSVEADVVASHTAPVMVAIAVIAPEDCAPPGEARPSKPAVLRVTIPHETRKAGPEVFSPQVKVAASYLGPMLAKRQALARGYDEVVLLDGDGRVAEAPTANVFVVKDGALVTPPTDRVLAGITRASVLEIARMEGIPAREEHLSPQDLAGADEAFLAGTSLPVQAIGSIDERALRGGAPGPVTSRVKALLTACERGEDPRFTRWLVRVV
jgi:branched-chain amino acid aminotransferase